MIAVMKEMKPRLHPLKYVMWIGLASIIMMFAGLSSAYIVKSNQANWLSYKLPIIFWYSSGVILLSSITVMLSRKAFINRNMEGYKLWLLITTVLGILFVFLQYWGFKELWASGITLTRNVSFSFLYVIVGLHALHVLGGVVALIILMVQAYRRHKKVYTTLSIDLMSTYWHFVDILWIYLFLFLLFMG
ncbi:MAG: heme-copper oxidase subunit III [Ginsengibacter sp.]